MRTLIVEDELNGQETLTLLLEQFCPQLQLIGLAATLEKAAELIKNKKPELVFLDIKLGTQTVFKLLDELETIDFEIIFITAYENFAINAIKFMAIDYLLKPVDIKELKLAVSRAEKNHKKRSSQYQLNALINNIKQEDNTRHRIALATSDSYELVIVRDILYCTAEGSYTRFYLSKNQDRFVSRHLKHYEQLLSNYNFFRPHQSCLINLNFVKIIFKTDGGTIEMVDGRQLPIARNKKKELIELLKIK